MLDISYIRENMGEVVQKIAKKGILFPEDQFRQIDMSRRQKITEREDFQSQKNKLNREIGLLKKRGESTQSLEIESIQLSKKISSIEKELSELENDYYHILLNIPNLPLDSVPCGKDSSENVVIREWGKRPDFSFSPLSHWELGEINQSLDFPRATKIASTRFALSFGSLAKLERILIQFMLDIHTSENGYMEVVPPFLANGTSLLSTGNLPKFKDDLFKIENSDLFLIPTAEVPLTNIHREEVLSENELPKKYVAYSPCFRSEAGSYGKDIRGLTRLHQFNKIELMKFTTPNQSETEHEQLTKDAESILKKLQLHYRTIALCSGDLSFQSAKTYDLEVWMPSKNSYVEISSCSNFTDFQARRGKIKFKSLNGKKEYVHTLNGSGLAIGRTIAAIMENFQNEDHSISIPQILLPYFPLKLYL